MGTDAHIHIEVFVDDAWEHYAQTRPRRAYAMFEKMAGVRAEEDSDIEPISLPRGIPEDASKLTRLDLKRWAGDAHSASWLSWEELGELEAFFNNKYLRQQWFEGWLNNSQVGLFLYGNGWSKSKEQVEELAELGIMNVRFVFFFDN